MDKEVEQVQQEEKEKKRIIAKLSKKRKADLYEYAYNMAEDSCDGDFLGGDGEEGEGVEMDEEELIAYIMQYSNKIEDIKSFLPYNFCKKQQHNKKC